MHRAAAVYALLSGYTALLFRCPAALHRISGASRASVPPHRYAILGSPQCSTRCGIAHHYAPEDRGSRPEIAPVPGTRVDWSTTYTVMQ